MNKLAIAVVAGAAFGAVNLGSASAMPISSLGAALGETSIVQNVGWVCGRFRCWWQPNYYYYAPRVYSYGYVAPRLYAYGYAPAYAYGYAPAYAYGYAPTYGYRYAARPYFRVGYGRGWRTW